MPARPSGCLFCAIASGEKDGHMVLEDDDCVAFLDQRPLFPGHVLLVPREHHETLPDLPPRLVGPLFLNARLLSRALPEALAAEGSFVAVNNRVSQSVPHLHVHVVPRRRQDGLRGFFWPRQGYRSQEAMDETRDRLKAAVERLQAEEGRAGARSGG